MERWNNLNPSQNPPFVLLESIDIRPTTWRCFPNGNRRIRVPLHQVICQVCSRVATRQAVISCLSNLSQIVTFCPTRKKVPANLRAISQSPRSLKVYHLRFASGLHPLPSCFSGVGSLFDTSFFSIAGVGKQWWSSVGWCRHPF